MSNICKFCGCNKDVEREMFGVGSNGEGGESLSRRQFTGHSCWGTYRMNLTQLIKDMKEKGLVSVAPLRLGGEPKEVLKFWNLMADTEPFNPSLDYCQIVGKYKAEAGGSRMPPDYGENY